MDIDVMAFIRNKLKFEMVSPEDALPGREEPVLYPIPAHEVFGLPLDEVPAGCEVAYFAMGCYWGAEKVFWSVDGVVNTAVGFMGGYTSNPTYRETCTGRTGHTETVRVVFDPARVSYAELCKVFWEHHDPTTPNRQGNDVGTQYRSAIFATSDDQLAVAEQTRDLFQGSLREAGAGEISTQVAMAGEWWFAEVEHQQYLVKNPEGYDCHVRTGVACPLP